MRSVVALVLFALLLGIFPAQAITDGGQKPDVRLLIDISGSMRDSDPDNMRAAALALIVRLLPPGARAGVWLFGDKVTELVPHREVDQQWREQALAAISRIDNSGQRTNIPAALSEALSDIDRLTSDYRTSVVLLTDGRVDVSQSPMANARAAQQLLQTRAPQLGETGIPVHTIALSDDADWDVLESLAHTTGAMADKAPTAEKLTEIYLQVLDRVAPAERVPLVDSTFMIDDRVDEFTALAFLERGGAATRLVGPDGQHYDADTQASAVNWFSAEQFSVVTVHKPAAGQWRLEAASDARLQVTVISDLRLHVEALPGSVPVGRALELAAYLTDGGDVIRDASLLSVFELDAQVVTPDGSSITIPVSDADALPATGEFRVPLRLFDQPGRYQITVRAAGKTFHRELPLALDVYQETPKQQEISTREEPVVLGSLRQPMIYAAIAVLVLMMMLLLWSRHRRRQRLADWRRRVSAANADSKVAHSTGFSARDDA